MESKNAERLQQAGRPGAAEPSGPMPPLYTVTEVADYLHVSRSSSSMSSWRKGSA